MEIKKKESSHQSYLRTNGRNEVVVGTMIQKSFVHLIDFTTTFLQHTFSLGYVFLEEFQVVHLFHIHYRNLNTQGKEKIMK